MRYNLFYSFQACIEKCSTRMILNTGSDAHIHKNENVSLVSNGSDTDKEGDNIAYGLTVHNFDHPQLLICLNCVL
jgi:hypothetical protein